MAVAVVVEPDPLVADPVLALTQQALAVFGEAIFDSRPVDDRVRIDWIAALEELRRVTAGLQAAETVRFAQSQLAEQMAADIDPRLVGRGIADQVALARKVSPVAGRGGSVMRVIFACNCPAPSGRWRPAPSRSESP
jgi:hypothetical protein